MRFPASNWLPLGSLSSVVARWVHASVNADSRDFQKHKSFIGACAIVSVFSLVTLPVVLAASSRLMLIELVLAAGFILPLLASLCVSRTGDIDHGARILITTTSIYVAALAILSGGISSGAAVAFFVICIEAAFFGGIKSLVFAAVVSALSALGVIVFTQQLSTAVLLSSPVTILLLTLYAATVAYRLAKVVSLQTANAETQDARFHTLSASVDGVVTVHATDGTASFSSGGARDLFGVTSSALLATGLFDKLHLQDRVVFLKSLQDAVASGDEVTCLLRVRVKGNSEQVWQHISMRCRVLDGGDGRAEEIVCISQNSKAETSTAATDKAHDTDDSQRQFLNTISHELRTPLNAIIGFSEIISEELFGSMGNDRYREYAALIRESGDHLLSVVNDMLDASKIEAGKYELQLSRFDISDVSSATVKMLQTMATDNGVTVCTDIQQDLPSVHGDRRACQQILINLLSNAIKFTPNGGDVRISATQHGRSVKLRVKDTGIGFTQEFKDTIGQPFNQASTGIDRKHEGSGLGLSVVKGLVSLHGGTLDIHSEINLGTTVTVTLPFKPRVSAPIPANSEAGLIELSDQKSKFIETYSQKTNPDEGDSRARVSA